MTVNSSQKTRYHHGDLRTSLISMASSMLKQDGAENLSLRKLADNVGVSRTAPYHHFKDKNELLCAIAQEGFSHWKLQLDRIFDDIELDEKEKLRAFIHDYITYAAENPELYDLMFGRTIWKQNTATEPLKKIAYSTFQFQVSMTRDWQHKGVLPANLDTLRLSQVTWGTIHGIARLLIDGIYADANHIDEMCETAMQVFTFNNESQSK